MAGTATCISWLLLDHTSSGPSSWEAFAASCLGSGERTSMARGRTRRRAWRQAQPRAKPGQRQSVAAGPANGTAEEAIGASRLASGPAKLTGCWCFCCHKLEQFWHSKTFRPRQLSQRLKTIQKPRGLGCEQKHGGGHGNMHQLAAAAPHVQRSQELGGPRHPSMARVHSATKL